MEYRKPSTNILSPVQEYKAGKRITKAEAEELKQRLRGLFESFNQKLDIVDCIVSPISVVFLCKKDKGFTMKSFMSAKSDIEAFLGKKIEYQISSTDESVIEIAVLYIGRSIVGLRELIQDEEFERAASPLTIAAGVSTFAKYIYMDLEQAPHMLIEGTTGSGKTIFIDDILLSLIYKSSPEEVRFLLVDPKMVDLMPYDGIYHLLQPVITDMKKVNAALSNICDEIDRRYRIFGDAHVRDIKAYNEQTADKLPRIVVVLDEYKEMVDKAGSGVDTLVAKLTSSGRAVGVHVIIASQSSASYVIPGSIKSNLTGVVNFSNVSMVLGPDGKTRLLGEGDMLISPGPGMNPIRAKASYVTFREMNDVVKSVRHRNKRVDN